MMTATHMWTTETQNAILQTKNFNCLNPSSSASQGQKDEGLSRYDRTATFVFNLGGFIVMVKGQDIRIQLFVADGGRWIRFNQRL